MHTVICCCSCYRVINRVRARNGAERGAANPRVNAFQRRNPLRLKESGRISSVRMRLGWFDGYVYRISARWVLDAYVELSSRHLTARTVI